MFEFPVNYWAIILAALASFVFGFLWYSQAIFGDIWMRESGLNEEKMKKNARPMMPTMLFAFIGQLVIAYILAYFLNALNLTTATIGDIITTVILLWLGFVAAIQLGIVLWEMKSIKLYLLNTIHWLGALLIMGLIIFYIGDFGTVPAFK